MIKPYILLILSVLIVSCNTYDFTAFPDIASYPSSLDFRALISEEKSDEIIVYNNTHSGVLRVSDIYLAKTGCEYEALTSGELTFKVLTKDGVEITDYKQNPIVMKPNITGVQGDERPVEYFKVAVSYVPIDANDDLYFLCVKSDSRKTSLLKININGYVDTPAIEISKKTGIDEDETISFRDSVLDFGKVNTPLTIEGVTPVEGEVKSAVLILTNVGEAPLDISVIECVFDDTGIFTAVSTSDPSQSVCGTSLILPHNSKKEITVTFRPPESLNSNIDYNATIRLKSNDPKNRIYDILAKGTGINPKTAPVAVIKIKSRIPGERFPAYVFDGGESKDYDNANEGLSLKVSRYKWEIEPLDCQWSGDVEKPECIGPNQPVGANQPLEEMLDSDKVYSLAAFNPNQAGRYKIKLTVTDNDIPAQSGTAELTFEVPYDYSIFAYMEWDSPAADKSVDMDLHLLKSPGILNDPLNDCYYGNNRIDWNSTPAATADDVRLLVDSVNKGYEEVVYPSPVDADYKALVHFYSGSITDTDGNSVPVQVYMKIYLNGILKYSQSTYLDSEDCYWLPFKSIKWAGSGEVIPDSDIKGQVICSSDKSAVDNVLWK